jgi:SAM-dependent methyltransferase
MKAEPGQRAFRDHFSQLARAYAQYRPQYPADLFEFLAAAAPERELAWDCGTGNGQAALGLAAHFHRVLATDASPEQVAHAAAHPRVEYRVEPAEHTSLADGTCDLVTVAVAVHWFHFDAFYREVRRVLRHEGVLAVWTYHLPAIGPGVDQAVQKYYGDVLGGYWPEQIRFIDERYQTLPFPFDELTPPAFSMRAEWSLEQFAGFLATWSAAQRYQDKQGHHPLERVWPALADGWGEAGQRRTVTWPLHLRVGRP